MLPPELSKRIGELVEQRQIDSLITLLTNAVPRYPNDADIPHLLGWTAIQQGRLEDAITHFQKAVQIKPDAAGSWNNLGIVLMELERPLDALTAFRAAVKYNPGMASAVGNVGFVLARLGFYDQAERILAEALRIDPNYVEARHHYAYSLMMLDRMPQAEQQFAQVMAVQPNNPAYVSTFGLFREKQHRIEEATALFLRAIELNPRLAEAWNNLGNIHAAVWGNYQESLRCFDQTLAIKPQYAEASYHRGMVYLTLGDYQRGWAGYDFRPVAWQKSQERYCQPRWQGEPLDGKTILLHCEQGLGDTLQFIRYAELVKRLDATVVCEVQQPLIKLLALTPGIDKLIEEGANLPSHDLQIPLGSLPRLLGIPAQQRPYLFAAPERVAFWKEVLARIPGRKIGIAWQGEPKFKYDWLRSVPLAQFAPLAQLKGVTLISLQKFRGVEQIAANRDTVPVVELQREIDVEAGAFMDTAAIMTLVDLVITSDTATAHLAGGLSVRVWLATQFAPDWRWMTEREDSPWYPSMRLFRQTAINRWDDVFTRMASELQQELHPEP
jgi:tetratricopeptide (TPR) repeat protein